jgi:uncharacterized protein DUF2188
LHWRYRALQLPSDVAYDASDHETRTGIMSTKAFYHVLPMPGGGWAVKRAGTERANGHFKRKVDATAYARTLARRFGTELVVHGKDGRIQTTTARPLGYGSLRGQFAVRRGIDLTKPIYEQVLKLDAQEKRRARRA